MMAIGLIALYFALLLVVANIAKGKADNQTFFRGERNSPWPLVAFGMIGASISGVSFVSVPGMVLKTDMTYLQTCLGFIPGYIAVAFILLPIYYRLNLTSIYTYLNIKLGGQAYRAGASFFLLSKIIGAAVRFFIVCYILHTYLLHHLDLPFVCTVLIMVSLIWVYSRHGGIKTLVWTDTFQTFCMLAALILIIIQVTSALHLTPQETWNTVMADSHSRIFVFDDWKDRQYFWKQFLSGAFIVVVMTGLDQDMMQKNLTCKNLRAAQKDMCCYGMAFVPTNLLFLILGVLLIHLSAANGIPLPDKGDDLLPSFAAGGLMGQGAQVLFALGIVAASFSSADSALTAITTSVCVDLYRQPDNERLRRYTHMTVAAIFTLFIIAFQTFNSTSVIDAVYILCAYTYGPLLGLFGFALTIKRPTTLGHVWIATIAAPIICYIVDYGTGRWFDYHFGYELLMVNGLITYTALRLLNCHKCVPIYEK